MSLDPRHREYNCTAPFCRDCWERIKGNIVGVLEVADKLAGRKSTVRKRLKIPATQSKEGK